MGPGSGVLIVHNPRSRRGRATAAEVRTLLGEWGLEREARWVEVAELEPPREPWPGRAVAVGGDGTINAAARWLLGAGMAAVPLGIVPGGTGNNLARGLGIPRDRAQASAIAILGSRERRIDVIRYLALDGSEETAGARLIIQGGAWGFPAEIAARFDALRQGRLFRCVAYPLGDRIYWLLALAGVQKRRWRERRGIPDGLRLRLALPEEEREEEALAVFVGNEPTLGGGFLPCPHARVDDGRMDLCIIRAGTGESYLRLLRQVTRGAHLRHGSTAVYRQSPGPVELHFDREVPLLADGDIWLAKKSYHLEVLPAALRVIVAR